METKQEMSGQEEREVQRTLNLLDELEVQSLKRDAAVHVFDRGSKDNNEPRALE